MTVTHFGQLKAYWWNSHKKTNVELKPRFTDPIANSTSDLERTSNLLAKLQEAKSKLS